MLPHLSGEHGVESVRDALVTTPTVPHLGQGSEMGAHGAFTIATGIPVCFCDPDSPWQRGSNEIAGARKGEIKEHPRGINPQAVFHQVVEPHLGDAGGESTTLDANGHDAGVEIDRGYLVLSDGGVISAHT
ncbi:hypothetical protein LMU33_15195 [Streptomyces sp. JA03]|nr:hypothetical protein [Streptomyces barringtoniae]MCC5476469.1 hypothetical protein [Streptomyces barringtoniae]